MIYLKTCRIELTEEQREQLCEIEEKVLISANKRKRGIALAKVKPENNEIEVHFFSNDMAEKIIEYSMKLWNDMKEEQKDETSKRNT